MNQDQTRKPTTLISRRTGLDRRWIPSADRQLERRCGRDRRTIRKRSFSEPLALNGSDANKEPFPEFDPDTKTSKANYPAFSPAEKETLQRN
ncbi:MAG: hypothetical protein HGJ94_12500 [Desulfosarcina sp.]|nr:hypothetical protein [Desulfosarcina sp.]